MPDNMSYVEAAGKPVIEWYVREIDELFRLLSNPRE